MESGGREVISNRPGNKNYTGRGTVTEGKLEDFIVQVHRVKRYIYIYIYIYIERERERERERGRERERENSNFFFVCLF